MATFFFPFEEIHPPRPWLKQSLRKQQQNNPIQPHLIQSLQTIGIVNRLYKSSFNNLLKSSFARHLVILTSNLSFIPGIQLFHPSGLLQLLQLGLQSLLICCKLRNFCLTFPRKLCRSYLSSIKIWMSFLANLGNIQGRN